LHLGSRYWHGVPGRHSCSTQRCHGGLAHPSFDTLESITGRQKKSSDDGMPILQAALLAPKAAMAEDVPDVEMEEIAVDFEADDVEPPAAISTPAPTQARSCFSIPKQIYVGAN
jgi:hypothetical protein